MKIRADFVTNSSSSSFIGIKMINNKGQLIEIGLDSGNNPIDPDAHIGQFHITEEELKTTDGEDLFERIYKWFYDSLGDPGCSLDEIDKAVSIYGKGDFSDFRSINNNSIHYIALYSDEKFWDDPFGASLIGSSEIAMSVRW